MQLHFLAPPYVGYVTARVSNLSELARLVKPGEIVAVDIQSDADPQEVAETVSTIRRNAPWAVVLGRLRGTEIEPEIVHILRSPRTRGVRAVVHDREPLEPTLRRLLTRPEGLRDIPDWLSDVAAAPAVERLGG